MPIFKMAGVCINFGKEFIGEKAAGHVDSIRMFHADSPLSIACCTSCDFKSFHARIYNHCYDNLKRLLPPCD